MYAVLETSVLISVLRSRQGTSHRVLRAIRHGDIEIAVSVALVMEYEAVALRPGLVPLTSSDVQVVIDGLVRLARHQRVFYTWRPFLSDPDDDLLLELAVAAGTEHIITHNVKDFAGTKPFGVRAVTPAEALNHL